MYSTYMWPVIMARPSISTILPPTKKEPFLARTSGSALAAPALKKAAVAAAMRAMVLNMAFSRRGSVAAVASLPVKRLAINGPIWKTGGACVIGF